MTPGPLLSLALVAALLTAGAVTLGIRYLRRQHRALIAIAAERDQARAGEAEAVRALRLAAMELRGPATTLLGHADLLCADGAIGPAGTAPVTIHAATIRAGTIRAGTTQAGTTPAGAVPAGTTIRAIAHQMLDLADDLQHHALADAASRVLREEPSPLAVVLDDAVAAVQASLEPGRRHWRLPPDLAGIEAIADRRALAQILARVLGSAARFSQHDDWIDIAFEVDADRFTLIIADEGNGLAATDGAGLSGDVGTRGLGLGLALARVLMQAHGGTLRVEAVPSIGTRVALDFPVHRLIRVAPAEPPGTSACGSAGTSAGTRIHVTV